MTGVIYPLRFATYEAMRKAMNNDFSGAEAPFEEKDYGPEIGKKCVMRTEYRDACYEMTYITHPNAEFKIADLSGKSPTLSVPCPE